MTANAPKAIQPANVLWTDLALVVFLIGFDVVARLLPHAHGFLPIAASALFAGRMLNIRPLAIVVPVVAMAISSLAFGMDDWRVALVVYAALALPAVVGIMTRRWNGILPTAGVMLACSLAFFALSNLAVWAFSGLYPLTQAGLVECFVAALPFLQNTVAGDLFWCAVLFGGAWMIAHTPALARRRAQ